MQEHDEPGGEFIAPDDLLARRPMPDDARRMGLDRNTQEGAMIALAASLNPAKAWHRVIAWVMLVVFVLPVLLGALSEIF